MRRLAAVALFGAFGSLLIACGSDSAALPVGTSAETTVSDSPDTTTAVTETADTAAPETTAAPTTTEPTTTAVPTTVAPAQMPDVIGKSETEAREILADLGVDDVRISEVENVAQPGTVLGQVPKTGTKITGPVDLQLAKGLSPMPDWANKTLAEARPYFEERGISVTIEDKLEDTVAEGSILATVPAATETMGAEVKLVVAKRPVTLFIAETTAVERSCTDSDFRFEAGDISVNGATQQNSVWDRGDGNSYVSQGASCYEDYDLGRDWQTLRGNIGVGDTSNASAQCQFEIFLDNSPTALFNQTAGLGTLTPVEIDVTDKLRLRLRTTKVSDTSSEYCVWSSLRLIGTGESN